MAGIKVMISSVQRNLQPERDIVEKVLSKLGHECLRAETYTAPGRSSKEVCHEMARDCDIYVGIFGSTYGYIDPDLGISVTEMEYTKAREDNLKKVVVYIKEERNVEAEQQVFLTKIQDYRGGYFRHRLFSTPEELREQVRGDLIAWVAERISRYSELERDIEILVAKNRALQDHNNKIAELRNLPKHLFF